MIPFTFAYLRRCRGAFLSVLALAGVLALVGCGGGSGGPSGGSGGGGGTPTLGANTIVFASIRDGNAEIYRSNSTGANPVRITNNAAADQDPFLARNRQFIVFVSNRDDNTEIYRFNVADSSLQRLTNDTTDVADNSPVVSPDSTKIAWVSERGGAANIWTMDATGANQTQITTAGGTSPTFAPDGTRLAYVNAAGDIVIRTLATGAERITDTGNNTTVTLTNLTWSPNGATLAFVSSVSGTATLQLIAAGATTLTNAVTFTGSPAYITAFTWGPDSTQFLFVGLTGQTAQIFAAPTITSPTSTQVTNVGINYGVSWTN